MSSSYSANQYDSAFRSQRLQNWCERKHFKERPIAQRGHTTFIVHDRGHLLPGVAKVKKGTAWPDFKGTWDLPSRIPANHINPTSRSIDGVYRLKSWGIDPQHAGKSQPQKRIKNSGKQSGGNVQQSGAVPSSAAEARSASQFLPITGAEPTATQNQDLQTAVAESVRQPAEEKQAAEAAEMDRPLSQRSAAREKPTARE